MQSGTFHTTYASDMALRPTWIMRARIVLVIAAVLIFPLFANRYFLSLANLIMIASIGAIGLNILVGYTGQISIGHGAFLAVGAYTAGLLAVNVGMPMWLTIPIGAFATAAVGLLFGLPSLRLKGLYLAIATLAAQEIIIWLITGGNAVIKEVGLLFATLSAALAGQPAPTDAPPGVLALAEAVGRESISLPAPVLFGIPLGGRGRFQNIDFNFYWILLANLLFTVIFASNLFRSRVGRAFVAIRDQDIAAQVIGVDLFRYKLLAFATSSFFAGMAGALTAHYRGVISWERFTIDVSILYLSMIIIGGLGSVSGSIYGAAFMIMLPALLTNAGRALSGVVPNIEGVLPFVQQGAFGLAIVLFLIFEPEGIVKMWRNIKDYFRLWPFNY